MDCRDWRRSFSASSREPRRSAARNKANACRRMRKQEPRTVLEGSQCHFLCSHPERGPNGIFCSETAMGSAVSFGRTDHRERSGSLLTFSQFDPTYWTVLRTTNPIERLNKEFKRRTNAMEVTGGEISTYRCSGHKWGKLETRKLELCTSRICRAESREDPSR